MISNFIAISPEMRLKVRKLIDASEGRDGLQKKHHFEGELVRMVRLSSCVEEHTRTLGDYERMAAENPRLNDYFIPVMIVRESYKKMQERVDKIFEDYDRIAEASSTD